MLDFIVMQMSRVNRENGYCYKTNVMKNTKHEKATKHNKMRYMHCVSYLDLIVIPFLSSGFLVVVVVVVGTLLPVVGFTVSPRLGRNSFHKAILFGRILYLIVIFGLSPKYSPRSAVYWGQFVCEGVGLLGYLKSKM